MELSIESVEGFSLPHGCYIGVRIGDVLKQGRYEPQRCYHFPQMDRRRTAKIDVYQHVGSCIIAVDPDTKSLHELNVTRDDLASPDMRLKVSIQSKAPEAVKQQREDRTKDLKNKAKDYLTKHGIEERLSEVVKALLKKQPDDPAEFICNAIRASYRGDGGAPAEPLKASKPVQEPSPVMDQATSKDAGVTPFGEYYRANLLPSSKEDMLSAVHKQFPSSKAIGHATTLECPINSVREQVLEVLMEASSNGNLSRALKAMVSEDEGQELESTKLRAGAVLQQAALSGKLDDALQTVISRSSTAAAASPVVAAGPQESRAEVAAPPDLPPLPSTVPFLMPAMSVMGSSWPDLGLANNLVFI
mmetsp:Transcript_68334/g.154707  ORF Transcript_68334/g.154707 Transcript_68334/m.154707 type:complete len:360 (+) Transcript_68334:144-1223(+)